MTEHKSPHPASLYDVLEIEPTADERAIKSAFRRMARAHHPDVNPDDPLAHERFVEIAAAFDILNDPTRRELYDEFGFEGLADNFDPIRARWKKRADDHSRKDEEQWWASHKEESWSSRFKREYDVNSSSFKSVFDKAFRDFNPFQQSSAQAPRDEEPESPRSARGDDVRVKHVLSLHDAIKGGPIAIEHHDGSLLTINLPAGARDGEVLLIRGEGLPGEGQGSEPGDLLLTLSIDMESSPHMTRDGLDLTLDLPVTMPEAILGARIEVPTPHGACLMTLPEGLHSGARLRLKGMGIRRGDQRGDLYVVIQIKSPSRIDDALRALAQKLEEGYPESVRAHFDKTTS